MAAQTQRLMDRLGDSGEFDLVHELGPLVMHIAADAFLGPDISERITGFFAEFRRFSAGMDPVLPGWLPLPHLLRSKRSRDRLRSRLQGLIDERRRDPADPPDFLQTICDARYSDGTQVPDLVRINLILMHDLGRARNDHRPCELGAHRSAASSPGTGAGPRGAAGVLGGAPPAGIRDLSELRLLDRAVHETERLHPVAFILARTADQAFEVDGFRVREGSMILLSPAVAHRLPGPYPEPDQYRPDRFLEDPRGMRDLIGFGGGVRRYLGVHFAYLEMKVIITLLLQRYRLSWSTRTRSPSPARRRNGRRAPARCAIRFSGRRPGPPAPAGCGSPPTRTGRRVHVGVVRQRPAAPSISSLTMSACPACRCVSAIMCTRMRCRVTSCPPGRHQATGRASRSSASIVASEWAQACWYQPVMYSRDSSAVAHSSTFSSPNPSPTRAADRPPGGRRSRRSTPVPSPPGA